MPTQLRATSIRSKPAFTLVEILCVIVILAIFAAILLPDMASAGESGVAASAARTLMADLLYAQSRAISTHTLHYVVFDASNSSYSVQYCSGSTAMPVNDPETGEPMNSANNLSRLGGATIGQFNVGSNAGIVFDAMGIPYAYSPTALASALYQGAALSAPGTITVQAGAKLLTITIDNDNGAMTVQ